MASEGRERNEGFDAGGNEGKNDVGFVKSRDGSRDNGSDIDAIDLGGRVLDLRV